MLDSLYNIVWLDTRLDKRLGRILQSELTDGQLKAFGLKKSLNGSLEFYSNKKTGESTEDLDEVIDKISSEEGKAVLDERYNRVSAKMIPFSEFFTGGDKRVLDGFKVKDLELRREANENKKPLLTNLLFGYYG